MRWPWQRKRTPPSVSLRGVRAHLATPSYVSLARAIEDLAALWPSFGWVEQVDIVQAVASWTGLNPYDARELIVGLVPRGAS